MKLFSVLIVCEIFATVYGWGAIGHSIVALLAQTQTTQDTYEWFLPLIPWYWHGNLSQMASWPDNILYPDTNPTGYLNWQWSRELHYINIPDWSCNYDSKRDCVNDICVEGAIKNYTHRLQTEVNEIQQQEALYFLIHFMGDIHQPLHTGFTDDRGGNSIRGHFEGKSTNLHTMWDSTLIGLRIQRDFNGNASHFYEHVYEVMLNQTHDDDNDDNITEWIKQNIYLVCNEIYLDENNATMNMSTNFTLTDVYYHRHISTIEQRLARGGYRLGRLLNKIASNRSSTSTSSTTLSSSTTPTSVTTPSSSTIPSSSMTPTSAMTPSSSTTPTSVTTKTTAAPLKDKTSASTIALIVILTVEAVVAVAFGVVFWMRYRNRQPTGLPKMSFQGIQP